MSELPCIRCGDCAASCPVQLQPQQLHMDLRAGRPADAQAHGLMDCSGCGRCDEVCPSHIPLAAGFLTGKQAWSLVRLRLDFAQAARQRFEARNVRLLRDSIERAEREATLSREAVTGDAVAAAIERANARRRVPRQPG